MQVLTSGAIAERRAVRSVGEKEERSTERSDESFRWDGVGAARGRKSEAARAPRCCLDGEVMRDDASWVPSGRGAPIF